MNDFSETVAPKSDQLNADDLIAGPMSITITRVVVRSPKDPQPASIYFEGDDGKPYKPSKGMRRVMIFVWGGDHEKYVGRRMTLFREPTVLFGGIKVGGIQISHMSEITKEVTLTLTVSKTRRIPFVVRPLAVQQEEQTSPTDDEIEEAKDKARTAAKSGKEAFGVWWNSDEGKSRRAMVKDIMQELQETAAEADAMSEE